jgi:hypothetical protein
MKRKQIIRYKTKFKFNIEQIVGKKIKLILTRWVAMQEVLSLFVISLFVKPNIEPHISLYFFNPIGYEFV